jgi:DNA/RNA endonuclease YhcR with UshA esterase domain
MSRRRLLTTVLIPGLIGGACTEASSPDGVPGSVTAQVYIDRDGSGTLTAADSLVASFEVSVSLDAIPVATMSTDDEGRATFTNLEPARYRVEAIDDAPEGTVLNSNAAPTATVPFRGGADTVDFRFAFYPGSLAGRVYRDDNSNGSYDAGVDTPGAGLYVLLKAGNATVDSVTADANGAYDFGAVAPGAYTVQFEDTPSIDYGTGGSSRAVTVDPNAAVTADGVFTGSLIITVASARSRAIGAGVTVAGQLTVPPNVFTSGSGGVNSEIWVQDATGGIAVFSVPSSSAFVLGDNVEVSGTLGAFSGQLQIGSPTVTPRSPGAAPNPISLTVAQANARGVNEGRLVGVAGVRIVTVPGGTGAAFTVIGEDAATGEDIQIRVAGLNTGLNRASFSVGTEYLVAGILTQFNGTAQIKPRFTSDISGPISIAAARAAAAGSVVTVQGNITVPPNILTSGSGGVNSEIWVQDPSGGIAVFSVLSSSTLALGDLVEVTGTIGAFSGQLQITSSPVVTFKSAGVPPPAVTVTGAEFNALAHEGRLVRLPITITTIPGGTGAAFTVTGTAADGATVQIRVGAANTGLTRASFIVGNTFTVTGVLSQFNGTAQIKPRFATDVTP